MAITTTTREFKQRCVFYADVDFACEKVTFGKDIELDGGVQLNSPSDISFKDGGSLNYYRHSITIKFGRNGEIRFTAHSKSNLVADSLQDLITLLGNTDIACSGVPKARNIAMMVHVGTTVSDCSIYEIPISGGSSVNETFGALGFTAVGDSVTLID